MGTADVRARKGGVGRVGWVGERRATIRSVVPSARACAAASRPRRSATSASGNESSTSSSSSCLPQSQPLKAVPNRVLRSPTRGPPGGWRGGRAGSHGGRWRSEAASARGATPASDRPLRIAMDRDELVAELLARESRGAAAPRLPRARARSGLALAPILALALSDAPSRAPDGRGAQGRRLLRLDAQSLVHDGRTVDSGVPPSVLHARAVRLDPARKGRARE